MLFPFDTIPAFLRSCSCAYSNDILTVRTFILSPSLLCSLIFTKPHLLHPWRSCLTAVSTCMADSFLCAVLYMVVKQQAGP